MLGTLLLLLAVGRAAAASEGLRIGTNAQPSRVFCGAGQEVDIMILSDRAFAGNIRTRLFQTESGIAALVAETPWKQLRILAGQNVRETARLNFPQVRAETAFVIQWIDETNRVIGRTEVLVYPTNSLAEIKILAGENPPGVLDPDNQVKPLLNAANVPFVDLGVTGLDHFAGRLAIIGPFSSKAEMSGDLRAQIQTQAKKGRGIVWILPPRSAREDVEPSFFVVPEGAGCVVVAQAEMVSNLAEDPDAQRHLVHFARQALRPEPYRLPVLTVP